MACIIPNLVPLYYNLGLYWRVQVMDPFTYGVFFVILTVLSTVLVSYAYKKIKVSLKHKCVLCVYVYVV